MDSFDKFISDEMLAAYIDGNAIPIEENIISSYLDNNELQELTEIVSEIINSPEILDFGELFSSEIPDKLFDRIESPLQNIKRNIEDTGNQIM